MYHGGREAKMAEYSTDERFGAAEEAHVGSLAGWLGAGVSLLLLIGITALLNIGVDAISRSVRTRLRLQTSLEQQ